ncbi:B3 domain-containing protein [Trifolium repens]|nr:B3 domain-containing protein [Trifolium repens]
MAQCNSYSCVADDVLTVGTNWDVCDYDFSLKKRKSDLGNGTNNDDAVWRNWEDWEYYLPIKKRKIKGRILDYCEYDLPSKKRLINKEKSDLNNNISFLFSSIENNDSLSTSHDDKKIANKQETKKTCNVDDEWEIKKVLEKSDVCCGLSRLLLKKELTQEFVIPVLLCGAKVAETNGVEVQVWDVDTKSPHSLVFRIWTSAKSHVFTTGWVKDFVLRRNLRKGDKIGLHWDQYNRRFNFSVI